MNIKQVCIRTAGMLLVILLMFTVLPFGMLSAYAAEVTVNIATPGTLQDEVEAQSATPADIEQLVITGTLNSDDLDYIWKYDTGSGSGTTALTALIELDMSGATLSGLTAFPQGQFYKSPL